MKKIKSGNRCYPKSLKRKIAREYLSGKFSYAVAAEEYGLKNKGVVREFVKWYKKSEYLDCMKTEEPLPESTEPTPSSEKLKELESELAKAKLKIAGLEALIDTAEQELQIDIRKKPGTKQSK